MLEVIHYMGSTGAKSNEYDCLVVDNCWSNGTNTRRICFLTRGRTDHFLLQIFLPLPWTVTYDLDLWTWPRLECRVQIACHTSTSKLTWFKTQTDTHRPTRISKATNKKKKSGIFWPFGIAVKQSKHCYMQSVAAPAPRIHQVPSRQGPENVCQVLGTKMKFEN